jgi:RND family efflux transporter MFP subunit
MVMQLRNGQPGSLEGKLPAYADSEDGLPGVARQVGPARNRGRLVAMFSTGMLLLAVTGFFLLPRLYGTHGQAEDSGKARVRTVKVVTPEMGGGGLLILPATLQAFQTTSIYARVSGYLKNWKADIGTRVKAGQLLAEIDTPELDAQLEAARATLLKSQATLIKDQAQHDLALLDLGRAKGLMATKGIAQQEYDTAVAQAKTASATVQADQATIKANQAEVSRLEALQSFQKVTAPFAGVITRRSAEVGMLVAEGGGANNTLLFQLVQDDILRVQVQVPQTIALFVKDGDPVKIVVPELPAQDFGAKITRTASAVDPVSRTLTVEIELANGDGQLLAGSYAQVQFPGKEGATLLIPASTLLMKVDGPHVAVVSSGQTIHVQKVQLGRDLGNKLEVVAGLTGQEQMVINPAADLVPNETVAVAQTGPAADSKAVAHK